MIAYCLEKWNKNKDKLEAYLRENIDLYNVEYLDIVKMVVTHILNDDPQDFVWDIDKITEIDNGDYQGTLLFLIPEESYQPSEYEYLMTYVGYGSCSGCDTLMSIQPDIDELLDEEGLRDYMALCKDIITNMIKPYNTGWRQHSRFETVVMEEFR